MEERMEAFCAFTDLLPALNPRLPDLKDAQHPQGRIRILSREDLIASKTTYGRPVDLEDVRLIKADDSKGKE
jgi:hypothetical protein